MVLAAVPIQAAGQGFPFQQSVASAPTDDPSMPREVRDSQRQVHVFLVFLMDPMLAAGCADCQLLIRRMNHVGFGCSSYRVGWYTETVVRMLWTPLHSSGSEQQQRERHLQLWHFAGDGRIATCQLLVG